MKNVARFDKGIVRGDAKVTDEGYIRANAVVTRSGIFTYQNADGSVRKELRHPDDVWEAESIESMELIPVTNGHPTEKLVKSDNAKRLAIGYTGETIKKEGDYVLSKMVITDSAGVDAIMKNGRKELSLGYTVDLEEEEGYYQGERYDARQRNIRYNHLAIVDKARAGKEARIALDADDAEEILQEVNSMAKRKIKIDDDTEVMVEESTASYIDRLQDDLKNLRDERDRVAAKEKDARDELKRVEEEIAMIQGKLDKTESERDSMKDQLSTVEKDSKNMNSDSEEFKKAVNDRVNLLKVAENYLSKNVVEKLDSMSNLDIKKEIISVSRKSINLDGKSEIYVEAMFDTIIDDQKSNKVNISNVSFNDMKNDSASPTIDARNKMMIKQQNAHKGGNK